MDDHIMTSLKKLVLESTDTMPFVASILCTLIGSMIEGKEEELCARCIEFVKNRSGFPKPRGADETLH